MIIANSDRIVHIIYRIHRIIIYRNIAEPLYLT